MKIENIKEFVLNPSVRFQILNARGVYSHLSDEKFLKKAFKARMGKTLNLDNPKTFNEKLQWLKLHDRRPEYTMMVDKYYVKDYIAEQLGEKYVIPTYGIWEKFEDIDFEMLPNQFVLKCAHDSGGLVICRDKNKFDVDGARKKIKVSMNRNYFWHGREWPYKDVKPRIIAEKYMTNVNGNEISDYKIQCFQGEVDHILVCVNRFQETGVQYHYFDKNWNYLPYCPYEGITADNIDIKCPQKLDEMIEIAETLSKGIPQLRVDLYEINGQVYFGELTFFTNSGFDNTITNEADIILGNKLILPCHA